MSFHPVYLEVGQLLCLSQQQVVHVVNALLKAPHLAMHARSLNVGAFFQILYARRMICQCGCELVAVLNVPHAELIILAVVSFQIMILHCNQLIGKIKKL